MRGSVGCTVSSFRSFLIINRRLSSVVVVFLGYFLVIFLPRISLICVTVLVGLVLLGIFSLTIVSFVLLVDTRVFFVITSIFLDLLVILTIVTGIILLIISIFGVAFLDISVFLSLTVLIGSFLFGNFFYIACTILLFLHGSVLFIFFPWNFVCRLLCIKSFILLLLSHWLVPGFLFCIFTFCCCTVFFWNVLIFCYIRFLNYRLFYDLTASLKLFWGHCSSFTFWCLGSRFGSTASGCSRFLGRCLGSFGRCCSLTLPLS